MTVQSSHSVPSDRATTAPRTSHHFMSHATIESPALSGTESACRDESSERHLVRLRAMPDVRPDRVSQLKAMIAAGTFDTEHRLEAAIDRMLEELKIDPERDGI
jgi:anti-sigma28 factor (negative regulator of flagellin synthesis)